MYAVLRLWHNKEPDVMGIFDTKEEAEKVALEYRKNYGSSWGIPIGYRGFIVKEVN